MTQRMGPKTSATDALLDLVEASTDGRLLGLVVAAVVIEDGKSVSLNFGVAAGDASQPEASEALRQTLREEAIEAAERIAIVEGEELPS